MSQFVQMRSGIRSVFAGLFMTSSSTPQVPQYVLEDFIERNQGSLCNIVCTQPRRLSAIGLADRVARERGEATGETVSFCVSC